MTWSVEMNLFKQHATLFATQCQVDELTSLVFTNLSELSQLTQGIHHWLNVSNCFEDLIPVSWIGTPLCNLPGIIQNLMKGFISYNKNTAHKLSTVWKINKTLQNVNVDLHFQKFQKQILNFDLPKLPIRAAGSWSQSVACFIFCSIPLCNQKIK